MADTPYHRDDLANDLVEAALRIANKVGIAGVTLRSVARSAGVSQTAPYRHFKAGHSELMAAVAADGTEKLHDVLERAALQAASSSRERVLNVAEAYVRFALEQPQRYRMMSERPEPSPRRAGKGRTRDPGLETYERLADAKAYAFVLLVDIMEVARSTGDFRNHPPDRMAHALSALLHGVSLQFIDEHLGQGLDRAQALRRVRELVGVLLDGIAQ
jgi:AcrR family transcriptional regulator